MAFTFEPIGVIHSCFKEKFGIPRQPGLVPAASARMELFPGHVPPESLKGIEKYSHLWVVTIFHKTMGLNKKSSVRPPRLGGNRRIGVFSTRSPFRPNPIGISAVEIDEIRKQSGKMEIHLKGVDFLDGTPVLDIKPYVGWSDAIENADDGFACEKPTQRLNVIFSPTAVLQCKARQAFGSENPQPLIVQVLEQDPRPAYHARRGVEKCYSMRLMDFDLKWTVEGETAVVLSLEAV